MKTSTESFKDRARKSLLKPRPKEKRWKEEEGVTGGQQARHPTHGSGRRSQRHVGGRTRSTTCRASQHPGHRGERWKSHRSGRLDAKPHLPDALPAPLLPARGLGTNTRHTLTGGGEAGQAAGGPMHPRPHGRPRQLAESPRDGPRHAQRLPQDCGGDAARHSQTGRSPRLRPEGGAWTCPEPGRGQARGAGSESGSSNRKR